MTEISTTRLAPGQTIAFMMSPRLGDSLLSMIVVNNLVRNGYRVTVFGSYMHALRDWFADFDIRPALADAQTRDVLAGFDVVMQAYPPDSPPSVRGWHPRVLVMDEWPSYRRLQNMTDTQMAICRDEFGLHDVVRENGLRAPAGLVARRHGLRVAIHPSANLPRKCWLPRRFLRLARRLQASGLETAFIVAPEERAEWSWLDDEGMAMPVFGSISALAAWLYESGWMIGNDSGIAHLASNLGVPAISLAVRRKIAIRWRPGWAASRAVLPLPVLPGKIAKDRLWKFFLPVGRVLAAYEDLRRETGAAPLPAARTAAADGRR
ncbi:glycosyltransferase family 9 protein [Chitinasiproducens palmae]|uniref:Glycosyltransferase family 9 (Heptosyltransferase) n=1 Tax=Chitinasiproducens palmae TaxID=1770053 RepID=A0A1H2PSR6_9BURK|nr:glycosyltransferase family 9 protein [Chitinasiproducens palmae]SDV50067.1 Glycosyltransferase family 9 (heptosyltransferase) [Chitinasiproducens palmae]